MREQDEEKTEIKIEELQRKKLKTMLINMHVTVGTQRTSRGD